MKFDDERALIYVDIDFDESKQFYLSGINVLGLDEHIAGGVSGGPPFRGGLPYAFVTTDMGRLCRKPVISALFICKPPL
jgi:hypothetical protein